MAVLSSTRMFIAPGLWTARDQKGQHPPPRSPHAPALDFYRHGLRASALPELAKLFVYLQILRACALMISARR